MYLLHLFPPRWVWSAPSCTEAQSALEVRHAG